MPIISVCSSWCFGCPDLPFIIGTWVVNHSRQQEFLRWRFVPWGWNKFQSEFCHLNTITSTKIATWLRSRTRSRTRTHTLTHTHKHTQGNELFAAGRAVGWRGRSCLSAADTTSPKAPPLTPSAADRARHCCSAADSRASLTGWEAALRFVATRASSRTPRCWPRLGRGAASSGNRWL